MKNILAATCDTSRTGRNADASPAAMGVACFRGAAAVRRAPGAAASGRRWLSGAPAVVITLVVTLTGLTVRLPDAAAAGGPAVDDALQPENVAIVVNADSWASVALADAYARIRGIPANHVVTVSGLSSFEGIGIDEFREKILAPVLAEIEQRGLREKIDCLAYSADIPFAISFRSDLGDKPPPPHVGQIGSLTGLTYLHEAVLARAAHDYTNLNSNFYARRARADGSDATASEAEPIPQREEELRNLTVRAPRRFRCGIAWDSRGEPTDAAGGRRYLMSTMLGVTSGRGLSLREAVDGLARSAAADGTRPAGTIVYMTNEDIRARTRRWGFEAAIRLLQEAGVAAVIEKGSLPNGRQDIAGAMVGVASFDIVGSGGRILPGAICEHLTSFGGIVTWGAGQTPLTEFLRHGAAGASGTVTEPLAIQAKFPDPFIQVHYVRGASLAEAFYQSVAGPYQLLIVGDPLCRPWAKQPAAPAAAPQRLTLPAAFGPLSADEPAGDGPLGLGFRVIDARGTRVVSGQNGMRLYGDAAALAANAELTIDGFVEAIAAEVHQFQVCSSDEVTLAVSGQNLPSTGRGPWRTYPVALEPGWHSVRLTVKAGADSRGPKQPLALNFGAVGAPPLLPQIRYQRRQGDRIHHVGLSPRVVMPQPPPDQLARDLRFTVDGLQPTTSGTLTMQWDVPADSSWVIEPSRADVRVDKGVAEPFSFRLQFRGAPFSTDAFFPSGCRCALEVQTEFGIESADSVRLPAKIVPR